MQTTIETLKEAILAKLATIAIKDTKTEKDLLNLGLTLKDINQIKKELSQENIDWSIIPPQQIIEALV